MNASCRNNYSYAPLDGIGSPEVLNKVRGDTCMIAAETERLLFGVAADDLGPSKVKTAC